MCVGDLYVCSGIWHSYSISVVANRLLLQDTEFEISPSLLQLQGGGGTVSKAPASLQPHMGGMAASRSSLPEL